MISLAQEGSPPTLWQSGAEVSRIFHAQRQQSARSSARTSTLTDEELTRQRLILVGVECVVRPLHIALALGCACCDLVRNAIAILKINRAIAPSIGIVQIEKIIHLT